MNLKNKFEEIIEYIISLCIIVDFNTVWSCNVESGKDLKTINSIIMILLLIILIISSFRKTKKSKKVLYKTIILVTFVFIYNITFILLNKENMFSFIVKFIIIFALFLIYNYIKLEKNDAKSLLIKISNIIISLATISLFFYLTASTLNILKPTSQTYIYWGDYKTINNYYNLYYEIGMANISFFRVWRNVGIFTEPPMYAFMLDIALLTQLFIVKSNNRKRIVILLITIITTFSATGIIISSSSFLIYFLLKGNNVKAYKILKVLIMPVVVFISISSSLFFIYDKVSASKFSGNGSYSVRMDDFEVGLRVWSENKFIGTGYANQGNIVKYIDTNVRGTDIGGSSGIMTVMAQGGLYLLSIYLIPQLLVIVCSLKRRQKISLILGIEITLLFIVTNVPYTLIIIYLLTFAYSYSINNSKVII